MATDVRLKEQLPELTERIVETYTSRRQDQPPRPLPAPQHDAVIDIWRISKRSSTPATAAAKGCTSGNVTYHVGDLIDGLHDKLTQQIARALRHEARHAGELRSPERRATTSRRWARPRRFAFWKQLPDLREHAGARRQGRLRRRPGRERLDEIIFCYPGLEAVTIYRLAHVLYELDVPLIPADDDRMGPQPDRHRHSPRRAHRHVSSSSITAPAW